MKLTRDNLKIHQHKVSDFIYNKATKGGCLCFLDVGAGKTGATIDALRKLYDGFLMHKCLVVSTKRIVDYVWLKELEVWEQGNDFKVATREQVLRAKKLVHSPEGSQARKYIKEIDKKLRVTELKFLPKDTQREYRKQKRLVKKLQTEYLKNLDADIYFINVEMYRWLQETLGNFWFFDTQVFDESSLFRNPRSLRFKAAKKATQATSTNICLTATPTPNGYANLWAQSFLVDAGLRLGKNITSFRNDYCFQVGFSYIVRQAAQIDIREKVRDIVISLDASDFMNITLEPVHENFVLSFSNENQEQYSELEKEFYLEVEGQEILAPNAVGKMNKLKQFCNGAIYTEDKEVVEIHDLKIDALKELVDIHYDKSIIVAYDYLSEKQKILKAFPKAVAMEDFNQDDWDKGRIPMLVTHPKSGGHGLNLQHGGHILVWFTTTVDLELYQQMNGRINAMRQTQSGYDRIPLYYHLYIKGSLEEKIINARKKKDITQKELIKRLIMPTPEES